ICLTFGFASALITFPRARRERFIFCPSRRRAPVALVALALSEPARSIRLILAIQTLGLRLAVFSFWNLKTQSFLQLITHIMTTKCYCQEAKPTRIY
uniref:Uncharacterized protein n=1 Tax=Gouania willdenowi TaxID=441366 RepID=A0A8C5E630_GOUWI